MSGVNKVILVGNLGQDPEVRETKSGTNVANFTLATNEVRGSGEDREELVEWHRIVAFGKTAELCGKYLAKGRQVFIEGKIQTRKYEGKDGVERQSTEVIANQVTFLGGKENSSRQKADF